MKTHQQFFQIETKCRLKKLMNINFYFKTQMNKTNGEKFMFLQIIRFFQFGLSIYANQFFFKATQAKFNGYYLEPNEFFKYYYIVIDMLQA